MGKPTHIFSFSSYQLTSLRICENFATQIMFWWLLVKKLWTTNTTIIWAECQRNTIVPQCRCPDYIIVLSSLFRNWQNSPWRHLVSPIQGHRFHGSTTRNHKTFTHRSSMSYHLYLIIKWFRICNILSMMKQFSFPYTAELNSHLFKNDHSSVFIIEIKNSVCSLGPPPHPEVLCLISTIPQSTGFYL